jgi:uncharacterized damage-inducible protein DinB
MANVLCREFLEELESEVASSRKCLEKIPESLFKWKPHERSMEMGYLASLVAGIPRWITFMIEKGVIDLSSFGRDGSKSSGDLVKQFDQNLEGVRKALQNANDESLSEPFTLKNQDQVLFSSPKRESIRQAINHLVHHRGQLTVYMRLNNIPVPSIYGPSADDRVF